MAINYPTSLDSFTNPETSDQMDSVTVPHATQHADANDAIEALEAKVGIDASAVATSHEYRITQMETGGASGTVAIYGGNLYLIHPSSGDWHLMTPVVDGGGNLTYDIDQTGISPLA